MAPAKRDRIGFYCRGAAWAAATRSPKPPFDWNQRRRLFSAQQTGPCAWKSPTAASFPFFVIPYLSITRLPPAPAAAAGQRDATLPGTLRDGI